MSGAPRIVISGYYGYGNAGDEAVLAGLADAFRAALPDVSIRVASGDPEATRSAHGLEAFHRYRWRAYLAQLAACDVFVSGGGSLFQNVTSRRSLYYYLATLMAARASRRPAMICGQGIGPLLGSAARRLTAALLDRAALITVRDLDSLDTLRALGVCRPPVHLTADPVFALTPKSPERADDLLQREGVDLNRPRILFAPRPWPPETPGCSIAIDTWARAAEFVSSELDAQPLFLPMHPPGDSDLAHAIANRAGIPITILDGAYSPRELLAIVGRSDLVVGMRLHALIFAAAQGVPLLGISYDPKIDGFLRLLGRTSVACNASIEVEVLTQALQHAWNKRENAIPLLKEKATALREAALKNGALLATLVGSLTGR